MLFSAVSLAIAIASPQAQQAESPVWKAVQPSVVELTNQRNVVGVAVLIDDNGLFLAHSSGVTGRQVKARFSDSSEVTMLVLGTDEQTQLTLLQAMVWSKGTRRPLKVSGEKTVKDVELLAVTTAGPKSGEFVGEGKAGVMRPSLRYVPLSEIRMKATDDVLGGAIVFNAKAEIVGVLGATLASDSSRTGSNLTRGGGGFGGTTGLQFGPQGQTVAYALGREVLQRVVSGFVSPSHEVNHPTIGIFFKASPDGKGVLVDTVMSNSPAGKAGIEPGDLILEVDGVSVNNPIDLAVALFRKDVGDHVTIVYGRGLLKGTAEMVVAGSQTSLGL